MVDPSPARKFLSLARPSILLKARALLEEARTLRQALSRPPVHAPAGLAGRIVASASRLNAEASRGEDETAPNPAGVTHSS